jgi:serine/threonine-protein kinase
LKPANVIVTPTRLKILDFGIASVTGSQARMTQTGFVMGSPMYMSPDQILGLTLDGRSDLYTLGLLGYCMITGREPYQGVEPIVLLRRKLREPTPAIRLHRPDTPDSWMAVMTKLLAKKPENRYQSARELIDALAELPVEDAEEVSEES